MNRFSMVRSAAWFRLTLAAMNILSIAETFTEWPSRMPVSWQKVEIVKRSMFGNFERAAKLMNT